MPLFSRKEHTTPATAQPVRSHHGATRVSTDSHRSNTAGGLFSSRRRTSSLSSSDIESHGHHKSTSTGLGGIFNRSGHEDPSLMAARERVAAAERAEKEADRALAAARVSVREAREHVKALEREASEEARLAKIKQKGAKDLNRRTKPLGRKAYY